MTWLNCPETAFAVFGQFLLPRSDNLSFNLAKVLNRILLYLYGVAMPEILIKKCIRKEPITREDYIIQMLKKQGYLQDKEQRIYKLPKAPGVFSLGPDIEPVQVSKEQSSVPDIDITTLKAVQNFMKNLF